MLKLALFAIALGTSVLVVIFGFWNARSPITQELKISIPKKVSGKTQWNIVAVSDVHLGTLVNRSRAEILTNSIMALRPDLVLFLGDTLDEDVASVTRRDIGVALKKITAPYGVYGITGNHEYIGGVEESVKYLEAHGITVLRDASVVINNAFELIGRDDRSNKNRKSLDELLAGMSSSMPLILLDHQPFHLREVAKSSRVDLQLSGHTHHGQLWPFNFITSMIYEVSWGYMMFDETQFYVSSGWGTWGPPIRTGNTPELIHLTVLFDK